MTRRIDGQDLFAEGFVRVLAASGARLFFVSPGSRSSPLALAAFRHGGVRIVPVIDERAAGFAALGAARVTGRPSVLIATSGTAGAHWYPAVLEAAAARLPLLLVTADRPPEMHLRGSNQTMDQAHLFGAAARAFVDVDAAATDTDGAAMTVARAAALTMAPCPGPVHVNVRLRKPLEPAQGTARPGETGGTTVAALSPGALAPHPDDAARLAEMIVAAQRPIFVAGPAPLSARAALDTVHELARRAGAPLLAEATSQLALAGTSGHDVLCAPFDGLLRATAWQEGARPDLIVQLGAAPISEGHARAAAAWRGTPRVVLHPDPSADPWDAATHLFLVDPCACARDLLGVMGRDHGGRDAWPRLWTDAAAAIRRRIRNGGPNAGGLLDEPSLLREVAGALNGDDLLALGNSLPVREIDLYAPGDATVAGVLHQRGVSGIDGAVAAAAGSAFVARDAGARRVVALIGDVAFAHDVGGLAIARDADHPLTIVVIDNGGGRLFDLLPIGERDDLADARRALMTTPPGLDIPAVTASFGIEARSVRRAGDTAEALRGLRPGCTVVHAVVDGDATARRHRESERIAAECAAEILG